MRPPPTSPCRRPRSPPPSGKTAVNEEIAQRASRGALLPSTIAANPTAIQFGEILDHNLMAHPELSTGHKLGRAASGERKTSGSSCSSGSRMFPASLLPPRGGGFSSGSLRKQGKSHGSGISRGGSHGPATPGALSRASSGCSLDGMKRRFTAPMHRGSTMRHPRKTPSAFGRSATAGRDTLARGLCQLHAHGAPPPSSSANCSWSLLLFPWTLKDLLEALPAT